MSMSISSRQTGDNMVCAMARLLRDGETVFTGLASHMPAVAVHLARALHAPGLWQLNTSGAVCPSGLTKESYTSIGDGMRTGSVGDFPLDEVFDLSMRGGLDVAFLSGVQFDRHGRVNSTVIGSYASPKVRLPGGAGSAVLLPTAKRVIVWWVRHDKRTFVENADFATARGNIDRVVTNLGVMRFYKNQWQLESVYPGVSVDEVLASTGFTVDHSDVAAALAPTRKELTALQAIDPNGLRYLEL